MVPMEGIEEAAVAAAAAAAMTTVGGGNQAGLVAHSSPYATSPGSVPSSSTSTSSPLVGSPSIHSTGTNGLVHSDHDQDPDHSNDNLFFASSASHTIFPASASVVASNGEDGDHNDNDNDHDDNSNDDGEEMSASVTTGDKQEQQPQSISAVLGAQGTPIPGAELPSAPAAQQESPLSEADLEELIQHPWTPASHLEFQQKFNLSNPNYKNKLRLTPTAEVRVRHFVLHPNSTLDPNSPSDARLKARSKSYTLHPFGPHGHLYRTDGGPSTAPRRHISETEVWELLTGEHVRSGHKGRDRMLALIKERFVGYTLEELMFVLATCRVCQRARMGGSATGPAGVDLAQRVKASMVNPSQTSAGVGGPGMGGPLHTMSQAGMMMDFGDAVSLGNGGGSGGMRMGGSATGGAMYPSSALGPTTILPSSTSASSSASPFQFQQQQQQQHPHSHLPQSMKLGNKRLSSVPGGVADSFGRRSSYAPTDRGLVAYDTPDWYF